MFLADYLSMKQSYYVLNVQVSHTSKYTIFQIASKWKNFDLQTKRGGEVDSNTTDTSKSNFKHTNARGSVSKRFLNVSW